MVMMRELISIVRVQDTGRKVLTLQTLLLVDIDECHSGDVGQVAGFNLYSLIDTELMRINRKERQP